MSTALCLLSTLWVMAMFPTIWLKFEGFLTWDISSLEDLQSPVDRSIISGEVTGYQRQIKDVLFNQVRSKFIVFYILSMCLILGLCIFSLNLFFLIIWTAFFYFYLFYLFCIHYLCVVYDMKNIHWIKINKSDLIVFQLN